LWGILREKLWTLHIRNNQGGWRLRLLPLLAATIAVGTDAWVVAGFLPALASDMSITTSTAGLSVTVFAVSYALAAPLFAAALSSTRPRRVIAAALVVLAVANTVCAMSVSFPIFLAGRVLAALAASAITPAAGVLASRIAGDRNRGRALALVISGLTIATAIGVPVGSVIASVVSWRVTLIAVAVLAGVAAVLIMATAPDPDPGARQTVRDRLAPLARARVLSILLLTVLGMTAAYTVYPYIGQLLVEGDSSWFVAVLTAYGVGAVAGSLGSGALTDRIGPKRTLAVAYSIMAATLAVLAVHPPSVEVVLLAAGWGAASWMQTPPQQHRLLAAAPEHGLLVIGTNASALYAGIALGSALGGVVLIEGTPLMCIVAATIALAALVWNLALPDATRETRHAEGETHGTRQSMT
jgi:DHA1 family inner membrane transport protein